MASERLGKILYTEEQISKRAKEIAAQIDKDFEGEEVILLCTLKGSILWIGDIMKNLTVKTKLDFIYLGDTISIYCKENDLIKEAINKFCTKAEININSFEIISDYYGIY